MQLALGFGSRVRYSTHHTVSVAPDDIVDARFRVISRLGRGAMAEVWCANDESTGTLVALKLIREEAAYDPLLVERMQREARLVRSITSPYVCPLLHSGEWPRGLPYLVFQLLRGEGFDALLDRDPYLPFSEVAGVIDNVLQGLMAAHAVGVIHRDLKPGNVFVEDYAPNQRRARILDFGISKVRDCAPGEANLTAQGAMLGTSDYVAPEQSLCASDADERADIYAVGTMVFRALAGRMPFESPNPRAVLSLKTHCEPPPLGEVTGETWPADLERFVQTALARNPDSRFATAEATLQAWRALVEHTDQARARAHAVGLAPRLSGSNPEHTNTQTMTMSGPRPAVRPSRSSRPRKR
jgi:eukaryotic-like serine/threonine-protein kinase